MRAGFVDGRGRAYDVSFRTLRASLLDEEGFLALAPGEDVRVRAAATASMDIVTPKAVPLLLPTRGELTATPRRVVFLAAEGIPRKDPFTFYNVSLSLHKSAIEHFFTVQGGREFVEFAKGDLASYGTVGSGVEAELTGPRPGAPTESARFRLRLDPRKAAEEALGALD